MSTNVSEPGLDLFDIEQVLPLFKRFIELVPDGVIGVNEIGRIVFANRRAAEIFGIEPDALAHRPLESLVPQRFRGKHIRLQTGYIEDPRTRPMGSGLELNGLREDGTEFPVDVSLTTIQSSRETIVLAFVRDLSEAGH